MPDIFCKIAKHSHKLEFDTTLTEKGQNYFGILHTTPVFRFYFTVKDNKIHFVPLKTDTVRRDAITKAILRTDIRCQILDFRQRRLSAKIILIILITGLLRTDIRWQILDFRQRRLSAKIILIILITGHLRTDIR